MRLTRVERMKIKRQRKRLTLSKVAEGIGANVSNLSKYEREQLDFPHYLWELYRDFIENYEQEDKY